MRLPAPFEIRIGPLRMMDASSMMRSNRPIIESAAIGPGSEETDCLRVFGTVIEGAAMKSSDLISVSTFRSTADAQIAKGILDESGIESIIRSDNAGGMYPAIGGADLLVRAEDIEKATNALHRRHHSPTFRTEATR